MQKIVLQGAVIMYLSFFGFSVAEENKEEEDPSVTVEPLSVEVVYNDSYGLVEGAKRATVLGILYKGPGVGMSGTLWDRRVVTENPYGLVLKDDQDREVGGLFYLGIEPSRKNGEDVYYAYFDNVPFKDSKSLHMAGKLIARAYDEEKTTESKKLAIKEGESVTVDQFNIKVDKIEEYEKKPFFRDGRSTYFHIDFIITLDHWGYCGCEINIKDGYDKEIEHEFAGGAGGPETKTWTLTRSFYLLPDEAHVSIHYTKERKIDVPINLEYNLSPQIK